MKTTVEILTISPRQAAEMLENQYPNQRKIGTGPVDRLKKEMASNNFHLSNDALVLIKGKLGNGQHRLTAIVQTKRSEQFIVLKTDDDRIFDVIDCGKNRRIADVLYGDSIPNGRNVAAIARQVLMYDYRLLIGTGEKTPKGDIEKLVSRSDVLLYVRDNLERLQFVLGLTYPLYAESRNLITTSLTGSLVFIASRNQKNHEKVLDFIKHVYLGDTPLDCPARQIRERLIRNVSEKAKLDKQYVFALLIKAYNAFLIGVRLGVLKYQNNVEDYPIIEI